MKPPGRSATFINKSMNVTKMPEPKRKIRDILSEGREVVQDEPPVLKQAPVVVPEPVLVPTSLRLPQDLNNRLDAASSRRKIARKKPWKRQEIVAAALEEWLSRDERDKH